MIQLYKDIFVSASICWMLSFSFPASAAMPQDNQKEEYTVRFGDSFHNYKKGSYIRIEISFKNLKGNQVDVAQDIIVINSENQRVWDTRINLQLQPDQEFKIPFRVPVPQAPGNYVLTIPNASGTSTEHLPLFNFVVIEPHKSQKLSLITVLAPDWEEDLTGFVDQWEIKASSISVGQAVLCGKKTWQRLADGDNAAQQLIERALRRDMSVVFLDFGPTEIKDGTEFKIKLPFDLKVSFMKASSPELNFLTEKSIKGLNNDLPMDNFYSLNGLNGISVPPVDMKTEGKNVTVSNLATTGSNPFRFPVVEVKNKSGKGRIVLCQVITEGRLDEKVIAPRNSPELPAYDPLAVQFVLNLISSSVGDELLK
jgi:hypothetical protein